MWNDQRYRGHLINIVLIIKETFEILQYPYITILGKKETPQFWCEIVWNYKSKCYVRMYNVWEDIYMTLHY